MTRRPIGIFISSSSRVRQELLASCGMEKEALLILSNAQNKGRRLDKHGVSWRTYEVNHTNLTLDDVRSLKRIALEA